MKSIERFGFATLALLSFSCVATDTRASAIYNAATDWNHLLDTAATTATWGAGGAWSAGEVRWY